MEKSPDAFRTISEVAEWLDTPAHVLRFWESRFAQVKPVKRAGGRRYYRPSDMALLGGIKKLLHEDGMTIRGVQKMLRTEGVRHVAALAPNLDDGAEGGAEGRAEGSAGRVQPGAQPARRVVRPAPRVAPETTAAEPAVEPVADDRPATAEPPAESLQHAFAFDAEPEIEVADEPAGTEAPGDVADAPDAAAAPVTGTEAPAEVPADPEGAGEEPQAVPEGWTRSGFPLRYPEAARMRLAEDREAAAALHARLVALRDRMAGPGR